MSYNTTYEGEYLRHCIMGGFPDMWNYGQYSSANYGAHTRAVQLFGINFYFSYDTVVAFYHHETGLVMRQNDWGPTTGKHMRWIRQDAPSSKEYEQVPASEFFMRLYNLMSAKNLVRREVRWQGKRKRIPAELQRIETGELINARNDPEKARTPGRTWARRQAERREREKAARKQEAIRKRRETLARKKEEARRKQELHEMLLDQCVTVELDEGMLT